MKNDIKTFGITALTLHILAMLFMLCDHLWGSGVMGQSWLTSVGRLAYPIFAFMVVEGFTHTHNFKKYLLRMFIFALISEIPFNLLMSASIIYPFHQNVIWTFLIALLCLKVIESAKKKRKWWLTIVTIVAASLVGFLIGTLAFVDYFGHGVLMVILFYVFRGRKWWHYLGQLVGLWIINGIMLGGRVIPITLGGFMVEFPHQGLAVLSLIPIWLYNGKQGLHNKFVQYFFYVFYPAHILILVLIAKWG